MIERSEFLTTGGAVALAAATPLANSPAKAAPRGSMQTNNTDVFWRGGARLVVSISMHMEAGAQPESGSERAWLYLLHRRCQPRRAVPAYAADLKREFDVLYEEGAHRRRMMSVSAHDRIAGRPARMRVLEDFIQYAQSHRGVTFMRKVDIANYAITSQHTVREDSSIDTTQPRRLA